MENAVIWALFLELRNKQKIYKKEEVFRKKGKLLLSIYEYSFEKLSGVNFLHQAHDLLIAGTNFLNGNIMIDNIDNTCKIFAHISFYIIWSC